MTEVETKLHLRAVLVTANALLEAFDGARPITEEEIQCIRETLNGASGRIGLDYKQARTQAICSASTIYNELVRMEAQA